MTKKQHLKVFMRLISLSVLEYVIHVFESIFCIKILCGPNSSCSKAQENYYIMVNRTNIINTYFDILHSIICEENNMCHLHA